MNKDKMVLIDGNNLLFRMFFGMPNKIYDTKGRLIHGTIGFVGTLLKIIKEYQSDYLMIVFDSEIPSEKFKDVNYKKNRIISYENVLEEENPYTQLPDIKKCLNYMGITFIEKEGCEADDTIATICRLYRDVMQEIIIISTDKDYFQLIDKTISVLCPRGKNSILYNEDMIKEKFGILPKQYILYSALIGDKSDNIPGIYGIGKVTASNLVNEYGSVDNIFYNIKSLKPSISKKLDGKREHIINNIYLITMDSDVNINIDLKSCAIDITKYKEMRTMEILSEAKVK